MRWRHSASIRGLPAVAYDAATTETIRRETTGRRSRAEPASARPATEAIRVARSARTDGPPSEGADSNERGRPTGDAGRGVRRGGLVVPTTRTGSLRWPARYDALRSIASCQPAVNRIVSGLDFGEAQLRSLWPLRAVPSRKIIGAENLRLSAMPSPLAG